APLQPDLARGPVVIVAAVGVTVVAATALEGLHELLAFLVGDEQPHHQSLADLARTGQGHHRGLEGDGGRQHAADLGLPRLPELCPVPPLLPSPGRRSPRRRAPPRAPRRTGPSPPGAAPRPGSNVCQLEGPCAPPRAVTFRSEE